MFISQILFKISQHVTNFTLTKEGIINQEGQCNNGKTFIITCFVSFPNKNTIQQENNFKSHLVGGLSSFLIIQFRTNLSPNQLILENLESFATK